MNSVGNKTTLDKSKKCISETSRDLAKFILIQTIIGSIAVILFSVILEIAFYGSIASFSNFNTIDIYSYSTGIITAVINPSVLLRTLGYFTFIFSIGYIGSSAVVIAYIFRLSTGFKYLKKKEETLFQASKIRIWLIISAILFSISFFLPSFGWIIGLILANASLNVSFYMFNVILSKYNYKATIPKNSALLVLAGSFTKIIFGILVFLNIYFASGIVVGSIFYIFAFRSLKEHIKFIAPVLRETPPPPSVPAPATPPPRAVVSSDGKVKIAHVPSPSALEIDEENE